MASGFTVATNEHLIDTSVLSKQLKQNLYDELFAMKWLKIIDVPGGSTTVNIASIGDAEQSDFVEGQAVKYSRFDTGNYTFIIDQYKYSANSISEKFKRDSLHAQEVISSFGPKQHRVIMEGVETRIYNRANAGQTASSLNTINEADHRWVASGTSEAIALIDFAKAHYALTKANVPMTNLVAVVDPTVAYTLQTQTNLVNLLSPTQMWAPIVNKGISTGTRFLGNLSIYGFDVYVSNYLPRDIAETISGRSTTVGVANLFFSATPGDTMPIVGAFTQMPTVYSEFNKDLQQTEYLTITEYGMKLYREENMVIVLSDTNVVV